jgi:serine/threonine protein kinase
MAIEELQSGRYRYVRMLGSGGMGEVYLMQDTRVSRQVAIKVSHAEGAISAAGEEVTESARLFEHEARAIAALEHPNILPLYDFGEETRDEMTITYMVMPYCADGSLESWLRTHKNLSSSPQNVAALIEQAAEALQYAHEHKVIHLDVKPSNFLLRTNKKRPQRPTLLLADFGIARNFTTVASASRTIRGTPTAMAPEQWSSSPVFASDQYALAIMAYELLTGRPPFTGSMEQLMYQHFTIQAPPPSKFSPRLPAALDAVFARALAKDPAARFPSIVDFASAFAEAAQQPANSDVDMASYDTLATPQEDVQVELSRLLTLDKEPTASPDTAEERPLQETPARDLNRSALQIEDSPTLQTQTAPERAPQETPARVRDAAMVPLEAEPALIAAPAQAEGEPVQELVHLEQAAKTPERPQALDPAPGFDLPTLADVHSRSGDQGTGAPRPLPPRELQRRFSPLALVSLLLVLLLVAGTGIVYFTHQSANNTASAHQSTPAPAAKSTTTVVSTATPTPTPAPGLYIAGTYNGSMTDNNSQQTTSIAVYVVQTSGQGSLKGSVTFKSISQQAYALHGTVDLQGNFSFTVAQPAGQVPFYFSGATQPGNYLHGNYCRTSTSSCSTDMGYFTVGPRS